MANDRHVAELCYSLLGTLACDVERWNSWRKEHPEIKPDLSGIDLNFQSLRGVDFHDVDLSEANLEGAHLDAADFSRANLSYTNLRFVFARNAHFNEASLGFTNFSDAQLDGADFDRASLTGTYFLFNDLSKVRGLERARYLGHSSVSIDTIYNSEAKLPLPFLRGIGLPDKFVDFVTSINPEEARYQSCFLSYSVNDEPFAERLRADLQEKGVRCWYAPKDLSTGARIRQTLDQEIRMHDKLLLVLSATSITSLWVEHEVESALDRESAEGRTILFPIRVDDKIMSIDEGWPALVRRTRNIGDFRDWQNYEKYSQALQKLLADLMTSDQRKPTATD